jgi:hypothetical protein
MIATGRQVEVSHRRPHHILTGFVEDDIIL